MVDFERPRRSRIGLAARSLAACSLAACSLAASSLAAALVAAVPASLHAQHVRVVLTSIGTANPVPGAIVSLERDGTEVRIAPTLSDDDGGALLAAPSEGSYRVRVDRVGAATWRSPVLQLARADTLHYRAAIDLRSTMLRALVVEGRSSCGSRSDQDYVMRVWDEARKGVLATTLNQGQGAPALHVRRFQRLLSPRGAVESESADSVVAATIRPFETVRSAAELSRLGYVVDDPSGETFIAPDSDVLLSEEFVSDHCLSLVKDRREPGLVGVAFEPVKGRKLPDIRGTFWLDVETSEPRRLTFEYVNVDRLSRAARSGGALAFLRLPTGNWIVNEWVVRTPRRGITRNYSSGSVVVADVDTLLGAREQGARILDVVARPSHAAGADGRRRELVGTVFDSLAGRPLPGVRLRLLGTGAEAMTDSLGHYALAVLEDGRYTLELTHPRLSLLRVATSHDVAIDGGAVQRLDMAIPPQPRLRPQLCPTAASDGAPGGAAILVGRTVSADDRRPMAHAALRLSYVRKTLEATEAAAAVHSEPVWLHAVSDDEGFFLFCHAPPDVSMGLVVEAPRSAGAQQVVRLARNRITELVVQLAPCAAGSAAPGCAPPE